MYYIYRHIRHDTNDVFYIGKGTICYDYKDPLLLYRRAYEKRGRNSHWQNITNVTPYSVEIMYESKDESLILEKEKEFIALYGRRSLGNGSLVNLTDGGEGMSGISHSEDTLNKHFRGQGNPMYGKKFSDEHKMRISDGVKRSGVSKGENNPMYGSARFSDKNPMYGKIHSQETKRLISLKRSGKIKVTTPENLVHIFDCAYDMCNHFKFKGCLITYYHDKRKGKPINRGFFKGFKIERI